MKLAHLTLVAALCASFTPSLAQDATKVAVAQDATKVAGVWQSESGITRVRVSPCGSGLCGTVIWQQTPSKDVNNPDPAKRDRPIVGLQLVSNMKPVGNDEWSGAIYNYEDGKTYSGKVKANGANSLAIGGCVMGGVVCQTKTWTKIN